MHKIVVRSATHHDVDLIALNNWKLVSENPADCNFQREDVLASTSHNFLAMNQRYFLAFFEDGDDFEFAGQIKVSRVESDLSRAPCLHLEHAYVEEQVRNCGVLQALLAFAEFKLGIRDWCLMTVSTEAASKYRHLGFRHLGSWMVRESRS